MKKALKFAIATAILLALGAMRALFLTPGSDAGKNPDPTFSPVALLSPAVDSSTASASGRAAGRAAQTGLTAASVPPTAASVPPFVPSMSPLKAAPELAQADPSETDTPFSFTPEQFQEFTAKTLRDLPTPAQVRDLTDEETHGYPAPLAQAGQLLGRISQAVQDQPGLAGAAAEFYIRCSQDLDLLAPVRALCYSHILKDSKAPPAQSLPAEVVRLAHLIPAD